MSIARRSLTFVLERGMRRHSQGGWTGLFGGMMTCSSSSLPLTISIFLIQRMQTRPRQRCTNNTLRTRKGRKVRSLQFRPQTPRLRLMGLDVAYPPPSIALTNPSHRHATLETILPLPHGDEASSSNGLTRTSHLRSCAASI